jgi:peptide-methionine (S)-S-oxide reductase
LQKKKKLKWKSFLLNSLSFLRQFSRPILDFLINFMAKYFAMIIKSGALLVAIFMTFSCDNQAQKPQQQAMNQNLKPVQVPLENGKARAYFASGCFWCVEAIYENVKGVDEAISGYSGGHTENPTYNQTNTGRTGHAEAVEVIYDPKVVSFEELVEVYFSTQDPTQVNGQGPDRGSQYRSIIFYQNDAEKTIAEQKKAEWAKALDTEIAAEIIPFQKFWIAEDYHQNYEANNPYNPYIMNVSRRRLEQLNRSCPALIKREKKE